MSLLSSAPGTRAAFVEMFWRLHGAWRRCWECALRRPEKGIYAVNTLEKWLLESDDQIEISADA